MADFSGVLHGVKSSGADLKKNISSSEHRRVMEICDDIPEQVPSFPIRIDDVGISSKTIWVRLPEGRIPFDAEISVNLPSSARGIHMSRIENCISEMHSHEFRDIGCYVQVLATEVLKGQNGNLCRVSASGKIPMVQQTPATGKKSIDSFEVTGFAEATPKDCRVRIGVGVNHITACPCTQAYNEILSQKSNGMPMPTHSQRSVTWLTIERNGAVPAYVELVMCLKASLHITYDLLKRPDEAEIVMTAHRAPQFAEDTTRETAREVGNRFGSFLPPDTSVVIASHSFESIHTHDVRCRITTTMAEILDVNK
ncbi:MAG: GTP cyclohydrolase I FolE2 [Desulfobacterales bacterium]|nr:GTP cyclohydrolase I FolE2 [Desulfobacterales bacterium]